ncbi:hypothetical protein MLD38_036459 [Melastoma candidum]|uniref:Uncharacterized protein n=1 Tax=Melastoma candidum TaxID=119954 RepID=A0ACB9LK59_9MYRT|nr:hypothetical protein MLD38_036459 [Melastoma candidum]
MALGEERKAVGVAGSGLGWREVRLGASGVGGLMAAVMSHCGTELGGLLRILDAGVLGFQGHREKMSPLELVPQADGGDRLPPLGSAREGGEVLRCCRASAG